MIDPAVSVVLPMYNAERYIGEAVASVLNQTFSDFELIIIDDGSTDDSAALARAFDDSRIHIVSLPHAGLVAALNHGIARSTGRYIARMDADDIAHPARLSTQVAYLEKYKRVHLLGTWFTAFSGDNRSLIAPHYDDKSIKSQLFLNNRFGHGTVMIRKEVLITSGHYRSELFPAEDYDLWLRISEVSEVANVPTSLYDWRKSDAQISVRMQYLARQRARQAVSLALQRALSGYDSLGRRLDFTHNPEASTAALLGYASGALSMGHYSLAKSLILRASAITPTEMSRTLLLLGSICSPQSLQGASRPLRRLMRSLIVVPAIAGALRGELLWSYLPKAVQEVLTPEARA